MERSWKSLIFLASAPEHLWDDAPSCLSNGWAYASSPCPVQCAPGDGTLGLRHRQAREHRRAGAAAAHFSLTLRSPEGPRACRILRRPRRLAIRDGLQATNPVEDHLQVVVAEHAEHLGPIADQETPEPAGTRIASEHDPALTPRPAETPPPALGR